MRHLKPKDTEDIQKFLNTNPIARMLKKMQGWKFDVGDILIRYEIDSRGKKHVDCVSTACPVPKKFRVLHIDDLGVPWVKQLSVSGGMGNKLYCLLNYVHQYEWETDPEQVDALLLGYKYDPRAEYKRMRESNPNYGKSNEDI